MNFFINTVQIVVILIVLSVKLSSGNQPSYQVTLYLPLHPQEAPLQACNGIIVQSCLILTTASCVHSKFSNGTVASIKPSMITIIGGTSLTLQVAEVLVAKNFNYAGGVNDLALLRLSSILPLDTRNDINWITLEDDEAYDSPCLANFYVRNSPKGTQSYIQSEQLPLLDAKSCRVASAYLINRENDICSLYHPPTDSNCSSLEAAQSYNADRGTGLVCGNKLIGLLSTILPVQNTSDCKEKPLLAYYTAVVPHITWIFEKIKKEDERLLNAGEYILSLPYTGETNAFIEPQVTEPATTEVSTTLDSLQTTEIADEHNSAIASRKIFWQLLFALLGIIYLIEH